jgi:hypothetical protein
MVSRADLDIQCEFARAGHRDLDRASLKEAAAQMDAMLKRANLTANEIGDIAKDFRLWRKKTPK